MLVLLACAPDTADIAIKADDCPEGQVLAADGGCYATEADADTDSDSDADSDADSDTDTGTPPLPDADGDGSPDIDDCAPDDATVYPGAQEVCDGADQDCDGVADDGVTTDVYLDVDADGYGTGDAISVCDPTGYADNADDCDDGDPTINPGATDDTHNEVDDDCDGTVDDGWDACTDEMGRLEHVADATYHTSSEGLVGTYLSGYGYVCAITCPDWWFTLEGATFAWAGEDATVYEGFPVLVDDDLSLIWRVEDPGLESWSTCTMRTGAGEFLFEVHWSG